MNRITLFFTILTILQTRCHIITPNTMKSVEVTTSSPTENDTMKIENSDFKKQNVRFKSRSAEAGVYMDDVLFSLRNQDWEEDEQLCLNQTLDWLHSLQNFTLWAVWEWDSIPSEPMGMMYGSRYQLGNFDECLSAPWTASHPGLRTQYCLTNIELRRLTPATKRRTHGLLNPYSSALEFIEAQNHHVRPINQLTWGACVPASCKPQSVKRLMSTLLARSHLGTAGLVANITVEEKCQTQEVEPFDGAFYGFWILIGLLAITSLVCTYISCSCDENSQTKTRRLIKILCLKTNAVDLLKVKKEGLEIMYGMRFLTICLIVLDHRIGIYNAGPISNGPTHDENLKSTLGLFILHDDLFVDTFFLLSGLLMATHIMSLKSRVNPLLFILKRYFRLVVAFAVVVFYMAAVFPYTGSGPLWPGTVKAESDSCKHNWWLNLLMVNNYVNTQDICIIASWYIPCDFHFFVLSVVLYWVYQHHRRTGLVGAGLICLLALVMPGILNFIYQLPPVQVFTLKLLNMDTINVLHPLYPKDVFKNYKDKKIEFVSNPRASEQFHLTYIKSHTRMAAYVMGVATGIIFLKFKPAEYNFRLNQKLATLGAIAGAGIMLATMMAGPTILHLNYNPVQGAIYAALDRPLWCAGLSLFLLSCCLGHVPLVKSFLCWYPWVPLSRLAYGLYLTHTVILTRNVFITRSPQHNDIMTILFDTSGVVVIGCISAFVIWLLAEAPVNNLLTLLIMSGSRKVLPEVKEEVSKTLPSNITSLYTQGKGHLQENMPATVQLSSKI